MERRSFRENRLSSSRIGAEKQEGSSGGLLSQITSVIV